MAKDFYTFEEMEEALKNGQATRGSSGRGLAPTASQRPTQTQLAQDVPDMISFEEADNIRESQGLPRIDQGMSNMSSSLPIQIGQPKQKWWEKAIESTKNSVKTTLGALTAPARLAASVAKPALETAVQFPRAFASGAAGLMGNEEMAQDLAKPVNVPGLGEVKPLSAVPGEASPLAMTGQAAEIASLGAGAAGASAVAKTAGKGALKQAVLEGAVVGAESGALSGFGQKAQEDEATLMDAAQSAITGAAVGGALGAAGGAIGAKAGKAAQAERAAVKAQKAEDELVDLVSPKMTQKLKEKAALEGRVIREGRLQKEVIKPSEVEKRVANSVRGIVNPKGAVDENIKALSSEVKRVSEKEVRPLLKKEGALQSVPGLQQRLDKMDVPDLFKSDESLSTTYKTVANRAKELIAERATSQSPQFGRQIDPEKLWDVRKEFDTIVKKQYPNLFGSERSTAAKQAILDVREKLNEFILDGIQSKDIYSGHMSRMSDIYTAAKNISQKAPKSVGTNVIERFGKEHQTLKEIAKYVSGLAVGGTGVAIGGSLLKD